MKSEARGASKWPQPRNFSPHQMAVSPGRYASTSLIISHFLNKQKLKPNRVKNVECPTDINSPKFSNCAACCCRRLRLGIFPQFSMPSFGRSEERRVGKECR